MTADSEQSAESNAMVEKLLRKSCIELGISTSVVSRPLTGDIIKKFAIPNTLSQAWYLGRAIRMARKAKASYVEAIVSSNLTHNCSRCT